MSVNVPRPEHPEPMWERKNWMNLNGVWQFGYDHGMSALDRKMYESDEALPLTINVPFCPESRLSGIANRDFMRSVVYKRTFTLGEDAFEGDILLHFGAVDYEAFVFVNGKAAGTHKGGYTPFMFDVTALCHEGENTVCVIAHDDTRSPKQCRGKQSELYASHGCDYTRTTGIWQTVWLEFVPTARLLDAKYYPDIHDGTLTVIGHTSCSGEVTLAASFEGKDMGSVTVQSYGGRFKAVIKPEEVHLWEVGKGNLYDLVLKFGKDEVKSYFGLREVTLEGMKFMLNDRSVFQRTVLDQGFYPDGIYTAPSEDALIHDIEMSLAVGFNGARLHQKVFEPRFLYHADRMGYLVWDEYPNWGLGHSDQQATEIYLNEWAEVMARDFNHPSIIGWCPFNETAAYVEKREPTTLLSSLYKYTKALDPTRVCIDTSGYIHVMTDIFDEHDYEQNVEIFRGHYDRFAETGEFYDDFNNRTKQEYQTYRGEPVFISEYGGIQWNTDGNEGWGYGNAPKTEEEFIARFKGLTEAMLFNPKIMGFCYTQLTDIEQEINGLYTFDRRPKFDPAVFKAICTQKAAIED